MSEIVARGSGVINTIVRKEDGEETLGWVRSPDIAVTASGVVFSRVPAEEGSDQYLLHVLHNVDVILDRVEFSALDYDVDPRHSPACQRCKDDESVVAQMVPPICPKCFRRATQ